MSSQNSRIDSLQSVLRTELLPAERASTLQALGPRYINSNPDSALLLAEQAFEISATLDDYELHSRSHRRMGHALYVVGDWDRFRNSLLGYVDYADANEDYFQVAASYRNLSKIGEATKQPDTSLYYLEKCLEVLAVHPDSVILIDVHLSQGLTYKYKGYYELSIAALLDGVRVAEAIQSTRKLGYLDMNLGITYNAMGRDEKSAFHMKRSIDYFEEDGNLRAATRSTSNLGFAYKALDRDVEAEDAFAKAITMAAESSMPNIAMHSFMGLADVTYDRGDYDQSLDHVIEAEKIAREIEASFTIGAALRYRAKIAVKQNKISLARSYVAQAERYVAASREPMEEDEYFFDMAEVYEGVGRYKDALSYTQHGHELKDSVYTLKRDQQFAELNLIYDTEKKDAQIQLLNKQTELDATRKKGLWGGLGAVVLLSGAFIYSLIQRKRKKEAELVQQREAESKKLELANQQLEFKKKELTAKALQLARKNEFLTGLESEIDELKSSVDKTVGKASEKISRMIQMDANDDDEWEQFGIEFSSVHQDFLDRLKEGHGTFSKSQLRLIALLKMNLSSKDIANTLRISDDGIKKARYRLRKKLGLSPEEDLQAFLMGL